MALGDGWQMLHLEVASLLCFGGSVTAERRSSGLSPVVLQICRSSNHLRTESCTSLSRGATWLDQWL